MEKTIGEAVLTQNGQMLKLPANRKWSSKITIGIHVMLMRRNRDSVFHHDLHNRLNLYC